MKPLSKTLTELGIAFTFPIEIRDANGDETYHEDSDSGGARWERDAKGYVTYYESSNGDWARFEYDANGNNTYYVNSDDYWEKWEYDADGKVTCREDSTGLKNGTPRPTTNQ